MGHNNSKAYHRTLSRRKLRRELKDDQDVTQTSNRHVRAHYGDGVSHGDLKPIFPDSGEDLDDL